MVGDTLSPAPGRVYRFWHRVRWALFAFPVSIVFAMDSLPNFAYPLKPNEVWAESPIFKHRLDHPDAHFLIDTYNGHVTGEKFYHRPGLSRRFLWPQHEYHDYRSQFSRTDFSDQTFFLSGHMGSEVGDPHIQELMHTQGSPNKTPISYGAISYSPRDKLWIFSAFEQNDQFSMVTYDWRRSIVSRPDAPWFGGNIPTRSFTDFGFRWLGAPVMLSAQGSFFWNWTVSPYSGAQIPWRGRNFLAEAEYEGQFGFTFEVQGWEDILEVSPEGAWRQIHIRPYWKRPFSVGSHQIKLNTYVDWTDVKLSFANPPSALFDPFYGYPEIQMDAPHPFFAGADIAYGFKPSDSARAAHTYTRLKFFGNSLHIDTENRWREKRAWGGFSGGMRVFTEKASDLAPNVREIWHDLEGREAIYHPNARPRGWLGEVGGHLMRGGFKLDGQVGGALEWDVSYFAEDTVFGFGKKSLFRSGEVNHFNEVMHSRFGIFSAHWTAAQNVDLWIGYKRRAFFAPSGNRLDFVPARHLYSWGLSARFPSNLHINMKSHWVGEKVVQGWVRDAGVFTVPSHFEHNITLVQTFLQEKVSLHYSMLHAFGPEIREHPAGNPLRFRIDAGADFRF